MKNKKNNDQILLDTYKNALLYSKSSKIDELKAEIAKKLSAEEFRGFLHTADAWAEECRKLGDTAVMLSQKGVDRDSLDFDDLQKKALELGGNAKGYICSIFDQAETKRQEQNARKKNAQETEPPLSDDDLAKAIVDLRNQMAGNMIHPKPAKKKEVIFFPAEWVSPKAVPAPGNSKTPIYTPQTPGQCMYQYCLYGLQNRKEMQKDELDRYILLGGTAEQREQDKNLADKWIHEAQKLCKTAKNKFLPEMRKYIEDFGGPLLGHLKRQNRKQLLW